MWDMIIFGLIIWEAIYVPFVLSFEGSQADSYSQVQQELIIDSFFTVDILLNFNTGFYRNGILIMSRRMIILEYLKSWFVIDLISTIPYSLIV